MSENVRPPVAVRIVRPFDTEDAFLENELETVGKTSVILIGAHPRPAGVILRFEVTLATGATLLRGEGRVLAHKENAFRGQPGLNLRFTRLDPRSKALVDRAAAVRDAKAAGDPAPLTARPPAPPPEGEARPATPPATSLRPASVPPHAHQLRASAPPPAPEPAHVEPPLNTEASAEAVVPSQEVVAIPSQELEVVAPVPTNDAPVPTSEATPEPEAVPEAAPLASPPTIPAPIVPDASRSASRSEASEVSPPSNRNELLARLRERRSTLDPERVQRMLDSGSSSSSDSRSRS
ncbi:Chaperone protein DnaK [Labilithrix luteola]|uniref:Chaperone protein DnaK n=1 Tax=Labilithrix luteola TaxID=1391654 RepID=A0A0K1Q6F0_9BACT|nr:hypothetical protein [Labilithrix luteola]AKV01308.1 Chaperone protein DnaK [Labilithrix luteola]